MHMKEWYFIFMLIANILHQNSIHPYTLNTRYGTYIIDQPVLIELLQCPSMQRLHLVRQYGIGYYAYKPLEYSRYQHSVGVFVLLRKFGSSLNEQIAGLLHDVSHTVFSHVADYMYYTNDGNSYQDDIHEWFINQTEIPAILKKYGIRVDEVLHKNDRFCCLERDLPDVCADRLEYLLYGGYIENKLSAADVDYILEHVHYKNNLWYFDSILAAQMLAEVSLYLTEFHFGSAWNTLMNRWAGIALKRAIELNLITTHDLHFSTDDIVWNILQQSTDQIIQEQMHKLLHLNEISLCSESDSIEIIKTKCRAINPLVLVDDSLQRLTDVDVLYKNSYCLLKQKTESGWPVRY